MDLALKAKTLGDSLLSTKRAARVGGRKAIDVCLRAPQILAEVLVDLGHPDRGTSEVGGAWPTGNALVIDFDFHPGELMKAGAHAGGGDGIGDYEGAFDAC